MYRAALPLHLVEGQRGLGEAAPQQVDRGQQLHTLPLELLHESVHPSQLLLHHRLLLELALCAHAPLYAAHQGSLEGAHLRLEQVQNARLAVQLHAHHVSADSARLQVAGRHPAQVLHELQLPGLELEPGCEVCHQLLVRVRPQVAQQQALGGDLPQQLAHLEARHGDVQRAQPVLQVLRGGLWRGHEQPQPPVHLVLALHAHHWLPREPVQPQRGRGHQQLLLRGGRVDLSLQVGPHLLLVHDRQLLALLHLLLLLRSVQHLRSLRCRQPRLLLLAHPARLLLPLLLLALALHLQRREDLGRALREVRRVVVVVIASVLLLVHAMLLLVVRKH
mmetsp:Transcript_1111/g.2462  ORF Transcript_1111/g.2462 Transcript_1111/m.2462 type:complete len:334 (+) Transcript_1111:4803-5804(+)